MQGAYSSKNTASPDQKPAFCDINLPGALLLRGVLSRFVQTFKKLSEITRFPSQLQPALDLIRWQVEIQEFRHSRLRGVLSRFVQTFKKLSEITRFPIQLQLALDLIRWQVEIHEFRHSRAWIYS